jgi:hypothetical protein
MDGRPVERMGSQWRRRSPTCGDYENGNVIPAARTLVAWFSHPTMPLCQEISCGDVGNRPTHIPTDLLYQEYRSGEEDSDLRTVQH